MKKFITESWHGVMNHRKNPLRHVPDENVRHLIMQLLAWMWCIAFSLYFSSWYLFGITVVSHFVFIIAIFVTVMSFRLVPEPEDQYVDDLDGVDWDEED